MSEEREESEGNIIKHYAIHRQVLLVASTCGKERWRAHVHVVPGIDHSTEALESYQKGDGVHMQKKHAAVFFGDMYPFNKLKYER